MNQMENQLLEASGSWVKRLPAEDFLVLGWLGFVLGKPLAVEDSPRGSGRDGDACASLNYRGSSLASLDGLASGSECQPAGSLPCSEPRTYEKILVMSTGVRNLPNSDCP